MNKSNMWYYVNNLINYVDEKNWRLALVNADKAALELGDVSVLRKNMKEVLNKEHEFLATWFAYATMAFIMEIVDYDSKPLYKRCVDGARNSLGACIAHLKKLEENS